MSALGAMFLVIVKCTSILYYDWRKCKNQRERKRKRAMAAAAPDHNGTHPDPNYQQKGEAG